MTSYFSINKIDRSFIKRFKNILSDNFYTSSYFQQIGVNPFAYDKVDLPILAFKIGKDSVPGLLFHLFFLGRILDSNEIFNIFQSSDIKELIKIGVLEKDGHKFESRVCIIPYKSYFFASDFILQSINTGWRVRPKAFESVYPVSLDSITLGEAYINRAADSLLDLGCGSGILSIISSKFYKKIIGVDINPRAVNFSQFNACLNGVDNCQFVYGDLYGPVKEEKFDLILSNPPYEMSVAKSYVYKNGGKYGAEILERILEGAVKHLKVGGYCQIITKIAEYKDTKKEDLLRIWSGEKARIYFLELYRMDVYQTAYNMCMDDLFVKGEELNFRKYCKSLEKIMKYLWRIKFKNYTFGIITLRAGKKFIYEEKLLDNRYIEADKLTTKIKDNIYFHFGYLWDFGNPSILRRTVFLFYSFYMKFISGYNKFLR